MYGVYCQQGQAIKLTAIVTWCRLTMRNCPSSLHDRFWRDRFTATPATTLEEMIEGMVRVSIAKLQH